MDTTLCLMKLAGETPFAYQGALSDYTPDEYEEIEWLDARPKPTWAQLEAVWPDIERENERAQIIRDLEATDADMARIAEDLIDCGGDPALLPQTAKDKIAARKALRTLLAELD